MRRALILDSNVDGGIRSLAAAPVGPDTIPLVSARAHSIVVLSWIVSCSASGRPVGFAAAGLLSNQRSSTVSTSVSETMIERSITFCSSRMLPGHEYDCRRSRLFVLTLLIFLPATLE